MHVSTDAALITPRSRRLDVARRRAHQFLQSITTRLDPAVDAELQTLVGSGLLWQLQARLTPFDRWHHLRVHSLLVDAGYNDPDLLMAALLHDVGKADSRGRVRAIHRVLHVVVRRISPDSLTRLAADGGGLRHGLWLSVHHPSVGSNMVRAAGGSERCCELIRNHDSHSTDGDPLIAALIAADNAASH